MRNATKSHVSFLIFLKKKKNRLGQCHFDGEWYIALHEWRGEIKDLFPLLCSEFLEFQSKQLLGTFYLNGKKCKGLALIKKNSTVVRIITCFQNSAFSVVLNS